MKKEYFYKTAYVKGLRRCCVGIIEYLENINSFRCRTPFGTIRTYHADELERFCL